MKLFLQLSALFAVSSAFIIPHNISDGFYVHTLHRNGSRIFTLLSVAIHHGTVHHTPPSEKFVKLRDLPLPKSNAVCGNGDKVMYSLNQSDVLGAIKKFHHNCNPTINLGGVGAGVDVFAKHGSALAFMCNYGGKWCKNDEFDEAFNMIKSSCGDHSGQNTGESSLSEPIFDARANAKC
jgi:hypothetical protein